MTPDYTLIQLLKLEPLNRDDIIKYTGWDCSKTEKTIEKCIAGGEIKYQNFSGKYLPTMRDPQGSPATQCLQPVMPAMRSYWDS